MEIFKSMLIAASGLKAQGSRMRVIAQNLANAGSTPSGPGVEPYRRQIPSFKSVMDRDAGVKLVSASKTVSDTSPFQKRFSPGHPAADEQGYIQMPNVNGLIEMMDMKDAQQSFQANLNLIKASRNMMTQTISLLRRS
jgi:flagellar basal-body rod protein FlgC